MSSLSFKPKTLPVRHAIAASFDLSGFSAFCRRPGTHAYLTKYISQLFNLFDQVFKDGIRDLFKDISRLVQVPRPDFIKYTGDGALILWVRDRGEDFTQDLCTSVVLALRHFQQSLPQHVEAWEKEWRTTNLPRAARIGVAIGPVQPLIYDDASIITNYDYAGYPINLAVRLQDHCPTVGFLIHKPLHPQADGMITMEAVGMKGTLDEPVYLFYSDYLRLQNQMDKQRKTVSKWFHEPAN